MELVCRAHICARSRASSSRFRLMQVSPLRPIDQGLHRGVVGMGCHQARQAA
jgi:hypothetical protein